MKRIVLVALLIAAPALAAPDDGLWQQLVGSNAAQCSQNLIDSAREIAKLRAQVEDLQKQLKAKGS
jgi:hypothetical protein